MHGSADRIAEFANKRLGAIGVSHLQVRLFARDADEHCDQIARFGAEVGPQLERVATLLTTSFLGPRIRDGLPLDAARLPRPDFAPESSPEIYCDRARAVRVGRSARLRLARVVGASRRRRRLDARTAHDRGRGARPHRARPGDDQRRDPAAARSDPYRRTDRGARQRVPGPHVGRVRRRLPVPGIRDGGVGTRCTRPHPRRGGRRGARGVGGRDLRLARPRRRRHAQARHRSAPHVVRRRGRAGRGAPGGAPATLDVRDEHRLRGAGGVLRRSQEDRLHGRLHPATGRPDLRARRRRSREGLGGDRRVRALRGADVRVVPDAGPALDARACTRPRSTT